MSTAEPEAGANRSRLVKLRILDKEVQVSCHPDEEEELMQAAAYVERAMRELRQRNATSSLEKIAIVTAINTASSLLRSRSRAGDESDATGRVARLVARIDELLTDGAAKVTRGGAVQGPATPDDPAGR